MTARVLVVGGAGYIGSHMVKYLGRGGYEVTTLDNLYSGHRDAVTYGDFVHADLADRERLKLLLDSQSFDAVMHFAAHIEVGESVRLPAKYYQNNVAKTLTLLETLVEAGVSRFIFSSTAAIFGLPERTPIDEQQAKRPINPYGKSKLMIEEALEDFDRAYGLKSMCLRYFNAAGADPEGELGERHDPETHLIPLCLQVASGRRDELSLFGTDYDTPDGTCIRDYVHVHDLCASHALALESLLQGSPSQRYNLGNGAGFSVREVIRTVERVTSRTLTVREQHRRAGDPARLIADSTRAQRELGWKPEFSDLETLVAHAWAFENARR
jgi:UDP-glucose 4-epimerase